MPADPSDVPKSEIRVAADALEYTREGLRTRTPLPLAVGRHNRIVIVSPQRRPVIGDGRRGFGFDSAFPLPATLSIFWHFAHRHSVFAHLPDPPELATSGIFQLYAHAAQWGNEMGNKDLTDRRAEIGTSLLRGNVDAFSAQAAAEGWALEHHQAMLRMLGCDPGPVDGKPGKLTDAAVALFQRRYHSGDFHRHRDASPRHDAPFDATGDLDDATIQALLEAFVVAHAAHVRAANVHPTHPAAGCSEFNPIADDPLPAQRRLTLVHHDVLPAHHDAAPCTQGDPNACAIVGDHPQRCMWFRLHVADQSAPAPIHFYDPRWLPLESGRYVLSALTTLDEDSTAIFEVFGGVEDDERALGDPISTTIEGRPRHGVVAVVWEPDAAHTGAPGEAPDTPGRPVFTVSTADGEGKVRAPWPKRQTVRILVGDGDVEQVRALEIRFRLRSTDGLYEATAALAEAVQFSPVHCALEFRDVPIESRFVLEADLHGEEDFDTLYFEDVVLDGLTDMCGEGEICTEPPSPPEPPSAENEGE